MFCILLLHASKVLFLVLSVTFLFFFFACHTNISGMAEHICAKFTGNPCWYLARTSVISLVVF